MALNFTRQNDKSQKPNFRVGITMEMTAPGVTKNPVNQVLFSHDKDPFQQDFPAKLMAFNIDPCLQGSHLSNVEVHIWFFKL